MKDSTAFRRTTQWPILVGMALLCGVLVLLYWGAQGIPLQTHGEISKGIIELREKNALVEKELIKTRHRINNDFDPLVKAVLDLQTAADQFALLIEPFDQPDLKLTWVEFYRILKLKRSKIERFKSKNAILKNFLDYYPLAVNQAQADLPVVGRGEGLSQSLNDLLQAVLSQNLNLNGQPFSADKALTRLKQETQKLPPLKSVGIVVGHTHKILRVKEEVSDLTLMVLALRLEVPLNQFFLQFQSYYLADQLRSAKYNTAIAVLSGLLIFCLAWFFVRLSNAAKELQFQKYALDQHAIVSTTDREGNITYVNTEFTKISQFTQSELKGKNHRVIRSDQHDDAFFKEMWERIASGQVWHGQIKNIKKGGGHYWVSSTIVPFLDTHGVPFQYISIRTDITAQKEQELEIIKQQEFLEGITSSMAEGVFMMDPKGNCQYLNPEAERQLGWSFQELEGEDFLETIRFESPHGKARDPKTCPLCLAMAAGKMFRSDDETFTNRDGQEFPVSIAAVPLIKEGIIQGSVVVFSNISDRKKAQEDLKQAKEEAEAANWAKSQFLAVVSHEIRTPLNGIMGMIDALMEEENRPQALNYLKTAAYSSDILLGLINDILDYSKIESGKLELEAVNFDLKKEIQQLVDTLSIRVEDKPVELGFHIDPKIPQVICGDVLRFRQILLNLAGNSIKFTARGRIDINVECLYLGEEKVQLQCSVVDTGIGIAKEKQKQVFESFTQAESSTTRQFGGTGLGLSITKQLVELMGGTVFLTSELGSGSTFSFTLDFAHERMGSDKPEIAASTHRSDTIEGLHILLAEDNLVNQKLALMVLKKGKATVTLANNGQEALEQLAQEDFDLVLMDLQMPVLDGLEATRQVRAGAAGVRNPQIPIIAMTANAYKEDRSRCLEAGMNDFISKPFKKNTLFELINTICNLS